MQVITTTYRGASNTKSARVNVAASGGLRATYSWDWELGQEANHMAAAKAFAAKLGWNGTWHMGATKKGFVFVCADGSFTVGPKSATPVHDEALRVLAAIATTEANSNSELDEMGYALDGAVSDAQSFFRLNNLHLADYLGPPREMPEPTSPTLSALTEALKAGTVIQSQVLETLHHADPIMPNNAGTIEAARFTYESDDVEIDDAPLLSEADKGCWVSAWVWVANSEASWAKPREEQDIPPLERCTQHRDTGRGVCADCGVAL